MTPRSPASFWRMAVLSILAMLLMAGTVGGSGISSTVARYLGLSNGTVLSIGAVSDGQVLTRSGSSIVGSSGGGVAGSTGSTDNAVLRADGTGGATVQAGSGVTISDAGVIAGATWQGAAIGRAYNGFVPVSSASAPTVGDDSADGYAVGQPWIETTGKVPYVLVDSTVGAAVWRSLLPVDAYEIRLTGGSWYAYPQAWTGAAWVDVGAGIALTVETAGSYTTSGATITEPSGTANNTQPHSSSYMAYIALSSLPRWSATFGTTYAVDLTVSSGAWVANARMGVALVAPTGAYDASSETLFAQRIGYTGAQMTQQVAAGTGTFSTGYLGAAVPTLAREVFSPAVASAYYMGNGTATASGALTIPTTVPTHLYVIGGAATSSTGSACTMTVSIRVRFVEGTP